MSIVRPSSSHKLRVVHWGQGHAIRSGASPNQAVGLAGLIEEVHYARSRSTRCLGSIRTPDGAQLFSEAAGVSKSVINQPTDQSLSPDVLRVRALLDCEDATITLACNNAAGGDTVTDTLSGRGEMTLEVDVDATTNRLLILLERRAPATTGKIYGCVFYEDTVAASELPT